jgi:2-octaprenyl-6-methoxyphenol hydroxylase
MANNNLSCDVVVIGAGPAGLTAAIALASADIETLLIGATPTTTDHRTTALLTSSVAALDALGIWERCRDQAASLKIMRIADDRPVLLRAPEVAFEAAEIGHEAFGYNIENRTLVAALSARAATLSALRHVERNARELTISEMDASITLDDGTRINTRLIIAADGRNSLCRSAAGIAVRTHRYPQTALALTFDHTRPHRDTSIEFHTEAGPFTLVPLPGQRSSLVWVTTPAEAETVMALDDTALAAQIEQRSHAILGKVSMLPGRGQFPLTLQTAERFAARRVALVGEAAHVMPPIGAQGLNLGLRDAAAIAELVVDARRDDTDPGAAEVLDDYNASRRADIVTRSVAVDALNRSLLTAFLPVQGVRGVGLALLDRIGPLRRAVMREGIAPGAYTPRLMRGVALREAH